MSIDTVISNLQSRIAQRGYEIADLEGVYSIRKITAYTRRQYSVARAIREEINAMAIDQRLDRQVLRELHAQRTAARRRNSAPFNVPVMRDANGNYFVQRTGVVATYLDSQSS